jgi:hypothetical protein
MARRDKNRRPNVTGRSNKSARFIGIPHKLWQSEAVCSLRPVSRALLFELAMMENGSNNGSLWLSVRDATDRLSMSDFNSAINAFAELLDRGLIAMTKDAHFSVKASDTNRARCWRLTWIGWPDGPKGKRHPSREWEQYSAPAKTPERKRTNRRLEAFARYRKQLPQKNIAVEETITIGTELAKNHLATVEETITDKLESGANQPFSIVEETIAHTAVTMGRDGSVMRWPVNDQTIPLIALMLSLQSIGIDHQTGRRAA